MCLLPLFAVYLLFYSFETYNSVKYMTCIFVVSTLILCGVFYVGSKIPFCVE